MQPYLASGKSYNLETVWQLVRGLYTNNSLNVTIGQTINVSEEQYRTVSDSFFNAETQALVTQGRTDAINIFLVDEVEGGDGGDAAAADACCSRCTRIKRSMKAVADSSPCACALRAHQRAVDKLLGNPPRP